MEKEFESSVAFQVNELIEQQQQQIDSTNLGNNQGVKNCALSALVLQQPEILHNILGSRQLQNMTCEFRKFLSNNNNNSQLESSTSNFSSCSSTSATHVPEEPVQSKPHETGSITMDRLSSVIICRWMEEMYVSVPCETSSLQRSFVYEHYKLFCQESGIEPVTSMLLGRLFHQTFPNVQTRRLGVRGNSKYHYCGIALKSAFSQFSHSISDDTCQLMPSLSPSFEFSSVTGTSEEFKRFSLIYRDHCEYLLRLFRDEQFDDILTCIKVFWLLLQRDEGPAVIEWIQSVPGLVFLEKCDSLFYDIAISLLFSNDPIRLKSPESLMRLRNFSKSLDTFTISTTTDLGPAFSDIKQSLKRIFCQQIRKFTSMNLLAQSVSKLLKDKEKLTLMRTDWLKLNFEAILDQASWVCRCDSEKVLNLARDQFVSTVLVVGDGGAVDDGNHDGLYLLTQWLDTLVKECLESKTEMRRALKDNIGAKFLLNWNYYSTLFMRDLTLRSASSFGCFQLLRLFVDEYLHYLVEQRITN